jgi:hypothetical protein
MITSREYEKSVHECTKWAVESDTEDAREPFLSLAKDWTFAALTTDRVEEQKVFMTQTRLDGHSSMKPQSRLL